MHLDRRLAGWGVFLVLLGAIPLLVRQGVLTTDMVARAWTLWPLLLIAAGVGLLLLRSSDRWTITLPRTPRLDLAAQVNAGTGRFDLADANLGQVRVTVNAGTLMLDLSHVASIGGLELHLNAVGDPRILLPNTSLTGSIDANAAGNIRLCPPAGAGLSLTANDNLTATNNYAERGLAQVGGAWQTRGYDAAAVRIQLVTHANAGGFNLEQEGSCGG